MIRFDPVKTVFLAHIDENEETYRITTAHPIDELCLSLSCIGMINPPVLVRRGSNFVIICGFRRISAARHLGWGEIPARILEAPSSHLLCAQLAIADNASQRSLNPVEASRAISLLADCAPDRLELVRLCNDVGLSVNIRLVEKLAPMCRLPVAVQDGIISNTISLSVAEMLQDMDAEAAKAFAAMFSRLKLSLNKQRELIEHSKEIAFIEDRSVLSVLQDAAVHSALNDRDTDRNRKAELLRNHLKQRRFPNLTRTMSAFGEALKTLGLDQKAKLSPPPDFEGATYTLTLSFTNASELENHKKNIDRILAHPDCLLRPPLGE